MLIKAVSQNNNWDGNDGTTNAVESQNRITGLNEHSNLILETRLNFLQDRKIVDKLIALNLKVSLSYRNRSRTARDSTNTKRRQQKNDGRAPDTRQQIRHIQPQTEVLRNLIDVSRSLSTSDVDDMVDSPVKSCNSSSITCNETSNDSFASVILNLDSETNINFNTYQPIPQQPVCESHSRMIERLSKGDKPQPRRRTRINYVHTNNNFKSDDSSDDDFDSNNSDYNSKESDYIED